jgi:hypothetical protein
VALCEQIASDGLSVRAERRLAKVGEQPNYALQRTGDHRGRPVLAMDGVLAGAEWAQCLAAELGR